MTDGQRRDVILKLLRDDIDVNCATPELARAALISSGIYTDAGKLKKEFGGNG